MTITLLILGIVLCICFSAFFSASEMALSSANEVRLENEAEEGNKKAKTAYELVTNFDDSLGAILVGNNLVNIAASSLSSVLVILLTGSDEKTWIATVIITVSVIIFGETMPKIVAKKNATRFSLLISPFIRLLTIILKPLIKVIVWLIDILTKGIKTPDDEVDEDEQVEELETLIETAEDEGVLDEDEAELMIKAIDFGDASAFEVMTARVDIDAIDIEDSIEEIIDFVHETPYSRIPVYEDSIDNIIGVLHLNTLLRKLAQEEDFNNIDIRSCLMEPVFVYKTTKLPTILQCLRDAKQHMAIVTDEYSGTDGLLTLEDVMEEIVGEIWDENDEVEEEIIIKNENEIEIDGDLSIYDFLELVDLPEDEFECDSDTVGGWVMETLERFAVLGDEIEYENVKLKVIDAEERRINSLLVTKLKPDTEEE